MVGGGGGGADKRDFMVYTLWIKNNSESNPHSYEATEAVAKKTKKHF